MNKFLFGLFAFSLGAVLGSFFLENIIAILLPKVTEVQKGAIEVVFVISFFFFGDWENGSALKIKRP